MCLPDLCKRQREGVLVVGGVAVGLPAGLVAMTAGDLVAASLVALTVIHPLPNMHTIMIHFLLMHFIVYLFCQNTTVSSLLWLP